ncbi:MAG: hypothetical protein QOD99_2717 [Chthoniobacter sp.]|jgi:hypothetical protein|nr:hypothetical protein [Chthoniobacter sp.]
MNIKLLAAAFALLVATSSGAFAISKTEGFVDTFMPAGKTVRTGSPQEVDDASKQAIASTSKPATVTTAKIVALGAKYAPTLSPDLVEAGIRDIGSSTSNLTPTARSVAANAIIKSTMTAVLKGSKLRFNGGAHNKADGAAAVTSRAVCAALHDGNTNNPSTFPLLLGAVVTDAIKAAKSQGAHLTASSAVGAVSVNGDAGVTTGAIAETAGVSNGNINDTTGDADANSDTIVKSVIAAAAKAGVSRIRDVAQAVGYAFAGTYRVTTNDGVEATKTSFETTNEQALVDAIKAGLAPKTATKLTAIILSQVHTGIEIAYTDLASGPGFKGINSFAYNNCNGSPVTDVSGL